MPRFIQAHATHPDPHMALALAGAQIDGQRAGMAPTLGFLYLSEDYVPHAQALLDEVRLRWPGCGWVGASALAVCASGVEYFAEPALALMVCDLPPTQWRIFSGRHPLAADFGARSLLMHADGGTPDLQELITELAQRCSSGYVFGGLVSGRSSAVQIADDVVEGGLSGLALGPGVSWISRVSQGCQPLGRERRVTASDGPLVTELDGQPALDALLEDLKLPAFTGETTTLRQAMPLFRRTLVGLSDAPGARREYGPEVRVRHLVGLDPARRGVAVAEQLRQGELLSFCERHPDAARRDLVRICTEIRAEAEERGARMAGAIYVSCTGRGGPHFGTPSAELQWVQHALGEVPLIGFFANGEIAHARLHGYTGVLTVFLEP
ncbi:FIST signal transduction protein [Roseateles amylovorans]|uniref:FIST C-terminal domain-containing protein n=1 Tax=Roseateles amylovorans TaxID=2978473 RepID=A0ABY6B0N5_9BURK|nr:FIST N-terminal domain-containing protein [Roseateles amylovorans]UXH78762.1 FIST C-terminal domain-containing protein [Roseateles amylovorans]